ncbi:ATP-dependent DNA helicase rep [Corynebacterium xerosis]|nr:ATP-dependent DNA helicase rep [Corynebacterium xerosis]
MGEQMSMAGQNEDQAIQAEIEQRALEGMYAHLDADLQARETARDRVLAEPAEGPAGTHARDLEFHRLQDRIGQLRAAEQGLCFGRIDRAEGGGSLHIGRIGMRTDSGDILLVDWRAEAARPFYAATMAHPMGVRKRRHLRVQQRRVVDLSDEILDGSPPLPEDVVGDGPLVAALGGARTGRMREAASTLQTEQDQIVRSPHRGVMVVDGGPGTGKTIVALHRAAYVLYAWPSVAGHGVLVHGPNQRFLTYISDVLPSLGENDVQLSTLSDLVQVDAQRTEPDHLARLKGRAELADALATWVRDREPHGVPLGLRTAHDALVLDAGLVDAARRFALQGGIGHNPARELFTEAIVEDLVTELEARSTQEDADFEHEAKALLGISFDRLAAKDLGDSGAGPASSTASALDIDWDAIRDELLEDPGIDRAVEQIWPRLEAEHVVRGVLGDPSALAAMLPDAAAEELAQIADDAPGEWSTADLALLDEARALVDGPPGETFGHVVVDEAQQLSPMHWRVLMRRCPARSMTVVGDLAQAGPTTTVRTWADALEPFVQDRFLHHALTINYRTTAEILETTRPLLARIAPDQQLSRSIRHGEPPRTVTAERGDVEAALHSLIGELGAAHPGELIGVVAPAAEAAALEAALSSTGVTVLGAPEARGLEFDTVLIVDPAAMENAGDAGLRDLYVAQTRATQRLITLVP